MFKTTIGLTLPVKVEMNKTLKLTKSSLSTKSNQNKFIHTHGVNYLTILVTTVFLFCCFRNIHIVTFLNAEDIYTLTDYIDSGFYLLVLLNSLCAVEVMSR